MDNVFNWYIDINGNRCKRYDTYEELLNDLKPNSKLMNFIGHGVFRGQARDWKLVPTLYREVPKKYLDISNTNGDYTYVKQAYNYAEYIDLRMFYKKANDIGLEVPISEIFNWNYLQDDIGAAFSKIDEKINNSFFEDSNFRNLVALAQHYGIKTRLLDWSRDFFVSLYFAARKAIDEILLNSSCLNEDMVIWAFPSDFSYSPCDNNYVPPIKFIVPDYNKNPNIYAQQGVLMYWDNNSLKCNDKYEDPLDLKTNMYYREIEFTETDLAVRFSKIYIPITECIKILEHIDKLGYNTYTLFPGYRGIVNSINEIPDIRKCENIIKSVTDNKVTKNMDFEKINIQNKKITLKCSNYKVSAGDGFILDNVDEWHEIETEATHIAQQADFCIEIRGNSMEPKFLDGDVVLVKKDVEINIGDIGIFELNGEGYIKELGKDCWVSLNPKYKNIYVTENDNYKCFGKVLGKAKVLIKV